MSEEQLKELQEYNLEYLEAQASEEMFGGDFTSAVELKQANKEIERLNKLISQREKKWEKWTTEKQILSSKMSDYLCKYQNIKREYTKQIKISTDRKNEIERLNNITNKALEKSKGLQYRFGYVLDDLIYLLMQGSDKE